MAEVKILIQGFTSSAGGEGATCPTITLVRDQGMNIVVDPGVLPSQRLLIDALAKEGLRADDINYVFITHSHLDHYRNIGMFAEAKTVEYFGVWDKGRCDDRPKKLTPDIEILETPGHNYDGLSLLVKTETGKVAIVGDVFWQKGLPIKDLYASDLVKLAESRAKILEAADYVVPGHGEMFKTG